MVPFLKERIYLLLNFRCGIFNLLCKIKNFFRYASFFRKFRHYILFHPESVRQFLIPVEGFGKVIKGDLARFMQVSVWIR